MVPVQTNFNIYTYVTRLLRQRNSSESSYIWSRCDSNTPKTAHPTVIDSLLHLSPPTFGRRELVSTGKLPTWALSAWTFLNPQSAGKFVGQPFHSVSPSPLPMFVGIGFFFTAGTLIHSIRAEQALFGFHWVWPVAILALIMAWINEVFTEESQGFHTLEVQQGFRIGIVLFILSEAMLFVSFFWAFFHLGFNPSVAVGVVFPPLGVPVFDWYRIPLLNTIILLSSGLSLTIAHKLIAVNDSGFRTWQWARMLNNLNLLSVVGRPQHRAKVAVVSEIASPNVQFTTGSKNNRGLVLSRFKVVTQVLVSSIQTMIAALKIRLGNGRYRVLNKITRRTKIYCTLTPRQTARDRASIWIVDTVLRGFIFLGLQTLEYTQSLFTIRTSAYGGVFFGLTGLHGFHVFVGAVMLAVSAFMMWPPIAQVNASRTVSRPFWWGHRVAFDGAAWYWHFVDVVWLFVFIIVYWWGGNFFQ